MPRPSQRCRRGRVKVDRRRRRVLHAHAAVPAGVAPSPHRCVAPVSRREEAPMAKRKDQAGTREKQAAAAEKIPRWEIQVDYIETCNCNFGCPCNFSGYPTDDYCEALVAYHVKKGRFGKTRLDGLDVIYAAAWPAAIHQGGGTLRLYGSEAGSRAQRG